MTRLRLLAAVGLLLGVGLVTSAQIDLRPSFNFVGGNLTVTGFVTSGAGATLGYGFGGTGGATSGMAFAGSTLTLTTGPQGSTFLKVQDSSGGLGFIAMAATPTIQSGFGTSPSITGGSSSFKVTWGTPVVAQTGVVLFTGTWANAPNCVAQDETTLLGNPIKIVATTTTASFTASAAVAADKISVLCLSY